MPKTKIPWRRGNSRWEGGDAEAGWGVYWGNPALPCIRCHLTSAEGETAGPNLYSVATRLDRRELLQSVVDPNAVIADGYQAPSSMPDIFDTLLSRDDLRNLVEALSTLKKERPAEGEHGK